MADCERRRFACGVTCLFSSDSTKPDLEHTLAREAASTPFSFALVFFSKTAWSPDAVAALMRKACPDVPYAGCSTAGEITPAGLAEGEIVVMLLPASTFSVHAKTFRDISRCGIERVSSDVAACRTLFLGTAAQEESGAVFAMCLIDGMSYAEEAVTAAIHWGLDDIPLIGGSAGDNMDFAETALIHNGVITHDSAIVLFVRSRQPFHIFKTENFVPTAHKLVVTKSDPDRRIVHELNARPAAIEYASAIGCDPQSLTPQSFASHPLVVRVGGEYYCRSIQKVNPDDSLSFFCAIDDGIVLTVAEPQGMARTTETAFAEVAKILGRIDFILGFDCVLRQIDARNRQVTHRMSEIYRDNRVIGFNTYGEQYRSMHLNQTFTGIAFGMD